MSLVTGGAGFVGSHLVDALIRQGDRVIIVDDMIAGSLRNIEDALRSGRAVFVYIGVNRPLHEHRRSFLEASRMNFIDRIFHLPTCLGQDQNGPGVPGAKCIAEPGTMSLIDLALEHRARFIHVSLSWVYEATLSPPRSEAHSHDGCCCEALTLEGVARRGLDGHIIRLLNCYGPRMSKANGRLIAELAESGAEGSLMLQPVKRLSASSMIFVDDAIRLLLRAATAKAPQLAPINIGSDEAGVLSRTPLNEGLAKTIAWFCDTAVAYA